MYAIGWDCKKCLTRNKTVIDGETVLLICEVCKKQCGEVTDESTSIHIEDKSNSLGKIYLDDVKITEVKK